MLQPVRAAQAAFHRLGSTEHLLGLALSMGSLFVAIACSVLGFEVGALFFLFLSIAGELVLEREASPATLLLRQAALAIPMRFALRVVVGYVSTEHLDGIAAARTFAAVAFVLALVLCGRALHLEYRRVGPLRPMETRNIPGSPRIGITPPPRLPEVVVAQALVLVPALLGAPWWVVLLAGAVAIAGLTWLTIPDVLVSWRMRQQKRATGFTGPLRQIQEFLDDYQPEVVVHLSGSATADYQINTWLETLESLDRRVLILLRNAPLFAATAPTSIPTLQLANAAEMLMLDLSTVRVALFPTNTGNNIHLLRLPTLMSAFIGHGDSDKTASNNPFSRAYDELWVAGEAGADRYRRSDLGVHEDQYRFVGRPQVHNIAREPRLGDDPLPTVLYAPTWEGVNSAQEYSSVSAVGVQVVQALLASDPPVRVVFKAHPFTGRRDAKYRAVLARIATLINAAAASSGIDHRVVEAGSINEWFNRATAMVTDISSVVSDFLASEKPYAVFNHTELSEEAFRAEYPSTAAGTVVDRDGHGIAEFIDVITRTATDVHTERRGTLATYLLGTPEQRSLESFQAATDAFIARSDAERATYRSTSFVIEPSDTEDTPTTEAG